MIQFLKCRAEIKNKHKGLKPTPGRHSADKLLAFNNFWHIPYISKGQQICAILKTFLHYKSEFELNYNV